MRGGRRGQAGPGRCGRGACEGRTSQSRPRPPCREWRTGIVPGMADAGKGGSVVVVAAPTPRPVLILIGRAPPPRPVVVVTHIRTPLAGRRTVLVVIGRAAPPGQIIVVRGCPSLPRPRLVAVVLVAPKRALGQALFPAGF